jgi:UDP-GlcNAc:undecaprenyl-phosphate GlcNAc-1-phosphate transferase
VPALALVTLAVWFLATPPLRSATEAALVALLAAFGLTPVVRMLAIKSGALDRPDARKRHVAPTPKFGGVAVLAGFILALGRGGFAGSAAPPDLELIAILLAALALMLVGALDDARGVPATMRLGLQVACAIAVILVGVRLDLFPAGAIGGAFNVVLSILWIVGITNAFNFIDGMDGLAASLGALIALLLSVVARGGGQQVLALVCATLAGALLGFLPHNLKPRRPASIFLGDSGSASVGFLLAALAIKEDWAEGDPLVALATPVLIFSVLIYDMIQTTLARLSRGRVRTFREWIEYVGRDHIHHRLTDLLGQQRRALALILSLSLGLGLSALGLRRGDNAGAFIFLVHGALILLVVAVLEGAADGRRAGAGDGGTRSRTAGHEGRGRR